jgi:hypothetical protein
VAVRVGAGVEVGVRVGKSARQVGVRTWSLWLLLRWVFEWAKCVRRRRALDLDYIKEYNARDAVARGGEARRGEVTSR